MQKSSDVIVLKRVCLLLISLTVAAPGITAEEKRPEPVPPAESPEVQTTPPDKRVPPSASTFTPSEKIKADSSVTFPVDI